MRDPLILSSACVLAVVLTVAHLVTAILERTKKGLDLREVKIRVQSWWWIVLVIEGALALGRLATVSLLACASFFALREYLSRVPTRTLDRHVLFWEFLAIPIQFYFVYMGWLTPFLCFIPVYAISVIVIRLLLTGQPKGFVQALSGFQLGLLTTVYSVSHIAFLPFIGNDSPYVVPAGTLIFFVALTQANDVLQFISGKCFGKTPIIPLISPKKTIEGFVGGVILSTLTAALIAPLLTPLNRWQGMLAGCLLATFGFFGDVLMSAIKRDLQIKDFSQIIPGHGGVLDRIDSLIISAPLYFHLIRYFH